MIARFPAARLPTTCRAASPDYLASLFCPGAVLALAAWLAVCDAAACTTHSGTHRAAVGRHKRKTHDVAGDALAFPASGTRSPRYDFCVILDGPLKPVPLAEPIAPTLFASVTDILYYEIDTPTQALR